MTNNLIDVLYDLNFGESIAENEQAQLEKYFVETEQWRSLLRGSVDIIKGPKGSGKSALYTSLIKISNQLRE